MIEKEGIVLRQMWCEKGRMCVCVGVVMENVCQRGRECVCVCVMENVLEVVRDGKCV
jgi:hypothetical protein